MDPALEKLASTYTLDAFAKVTKWAKCLTRAYPEQPPNEMRFKLRRADKRFIPQSTRAVSFKRVLGGSSLIV